MRKLLLLFFALLTLGGSRAWAMEVTWSLLGANDNKIDARIIGVQVPGTSDITYTLSAFSLYLRKDGNGTGKYMLISAENVGGGANAISESKVIAVSSNNPTTSENDKAEEFTFGSGIELTGGTVYYLYFTATNTPTNGEYTLATERITLSNATNYTPGIWWNTTQQTGYAPKYTATLTTEVILTDYNYSCKNLAGYELSEGVYSQSSAPDASQAPAIAGYTYQSIDVDGTNVTYTYALTSNPLNTLTTAAEDIDSHPTHVLLACIQALETSTFYYYTEEDGAVKGDYDHSTKLEDTHWVIVGSEANGYKLYNRRFGAARVAAATVGSGQAITMVDAASNEGTLFDLRYVSGAYRFYAKGSAYCTNRLNGSTKVIGIHENVNAGSITTILPYHTNALYKQSDIDPNKTYTIKSGTRGYLFVNASGKVSNNFSSTAESAAADANYQWAFVLAANGKYYLYNVGQGKFFGLSTEENRAAVTSLSTTDYIYLTSTKSATYYPLYLTGYGFNTSTYADATVRYVNAQGLSGSDNPVIYNGYNTLDGGNDYLITELNDFSSSNQTSARETLRLLTGGLYAENATALQSAADDTFWKVYTIKGKLGTLEANSENAYLTNTGKSGSTVAPTTNTAQQWVLVHTGSSYLLYNVGAEKYLSNDGSNNYALVAEAASASAITFRASSTADLYSVYAGAGTILNFPVGICVGGGWLNLNNAEDSYTYGTTKYDDAGDPNNMFRIEEINGAFYLETGYYRLKNKLTTDSYGYMGVTGSQPVGNIASANDPSTVLYISKDGEGKFTIQTQGKYTSGVRQSTETALSDKAPDDESVAAGDREKFAIASYNDFVVIRTHADGDYSYYHAGKNQSYKIVGWEVSEDATQWQIEKAISLSVTLNDAGDGSHYATFCAPFSYTVTGATAYTLTESGEYLVPTPIDGEVAAGTPVLLKGSSATATLTIGSSYATSPVDDTALTGTYMETAIDGANDYVLGIDGGIVGFYHWDTNTLGANRAYVDTPAGIKGFAIDWSGETGISEIENGKLKVESSMYNLAGQRVTKAQKGIFIVNGKKVVK